MKSESATSAIFFIVEEALRVSMWMRSQPSMASALGSVAINTILDTKSHCLSDSTVGRTCAASANGRKQLIVVFMLELVVIRVKIIY